MELKKAFFTSREEPILPTARVRVRHAPAARALTTWATPSREPRGLAGETEAGAVAVWLTAPPMRVEAPSHQPPFEERDRDG